MVYCIAINQALGRCIRHKNVSDTYNYKCVQPS